MRKIKEDSCGVATVSISDSVYAWSQGNNQELWMLVENGYTWATVRVETSREKRDDWTGKKKYRIVTRNRFFVEVRVGYKQSIILTDWFENKSVKEQIEYFITHKEMILD